MVNVTFKPRFSSNFSFYSWVKISLHFKRCKCNYMSRARACLAKYRWCNSHLFSGFTWATGNLPPISCHSFRRSGSNFGPRYNFRPFLTRSVVLLGTNKLTEKTGLHLRDCKFFWYSLPVSVESDCMAACIVETMIKFPSKYKSKYVTKPRWRFQAVRLSQVKQIVRHGCDPRFSYFLQFLAPPWSPIIEQCP